MGKLTSIRQNLSKAKLTFSEHGLQVLYRSALRKVIRSIIDIETLYPPETRDEIVSEFHKYYYQSGAHEDTRWLGVPTLKFPTDLIVYQEIIVENEPDLVIEAGTHRGGSAYFLASICELIGNGEVITVDKTTYPDQPSHPRLTYLVGSSTSEKIAKKIRENVGVEDDVMVILDSNHTKEHVCEELTIYSELVTEDNYIIVEDTHVNGNPIMSNFGPGPKAAVDEFLDSNDDFVIDGEKEKHHITAAPSGFLQKIN